MQASAKTTVNGRVELKPDIQDYEISGFFTAYEDHLDQHSSANLGAWLLIALGAATLMLGFGLLAFGPSEIYYYRSSGPTLWQYVQMAPGPVATVGSLLMFAGGKLKTDGAMSREAYLLSHYEIVDWDGNEVSAELQVRHLNENEFRISITAQATGHDGIA